MRTDVRSQWEPLALRQQKSDPIIRVASFALFRFLDDGRDGVFIGGFGMASVTLGTAGAGVLDVGLVASAAARTDVWPAALTVLFESAEEIAFDGDEGPDRNGYDKNPATQAHSCDVRHGCS